MDAFVKPPEEYQRDVNILRDYVRSMSTYLSKMTGEPIEACYKYVMQETRPGGSMPIKDPEVAVLVRQKNGDRKKVPNTLQGFLGDVYAGKEILSPSMTSYLNPDQKESLLGMYITGNLAKRKDAKHQELIAEMDKDLVRTAMFSGLQTSLKTKNNSLSGAHVSEHTFLFNKTAHSTLTSTCRAAASYGNANNEKFIMGNRHYWSPDAVTANILSIITHTDLTALEQLINNRGLIYPSVDQIMELIKRSTSPYWRNDNSMAVIHRFVETLLPVERAAFAYVGDFYHLAKFNDQFVRTFMERLSRCVQVPAADPTAIMKKADGDLKMFVCVVMANYREHLKGMTLDKVQKELPEDYAMVASTAQSVMETVSDYLDMIRVLWVSDNMPSEVAYTPTIMRRCAITSDTDSTIFTVQHWTQWYVGKLDFTPTSNAVAAGVVYLASQSIRHILAQLSANMGVVVRHRGMLQMKNEFMFPVFGLTPLAKHYFAYRSAREGNVYAEFEPEIKGVNLRNSAIPPNIMGKAKKLMLWVMDEIVAGRKISYRKVLKIVADVENEIASSIRRGSYEYFSTTTIKTKESYKNPGSSNYAHYALWEEVFADKYGHAEAPPYVAVKVSVDADNPTKFKRWCDSMEDKAVGEKLKQHIASKGRNSITTLLLPQSVLMVKGAPPEIIAGTAVRQLVSELCKSFYIVLESLGLFLMNSNLSRMASDEEW